MTTLPEKVQIVGQALGQIEFRQVTFQFILSQNHRTVEVGRDLWRSSRPNPLLKQGHLQLVVQDCVQVASEYLQGRRLHTLLGQPVPVASHPHSFSLCPLPLVLSLGTTEKSLAPSSLHPPFRYSYTLTRSPEPSLLQAEQPQLFQPFLTGEMLQSLHHLSGPSLDSLQYVHISLVLGSPALDTVLQVWPAMMRLWFIPWQCYSNVLWSVKITFFLTPCWRIFRYAFHSRFAWERH